MTQETRIEQLEMKIAFHEDNIETLNNELFEQQQKIQTLNDQVTLLVRRLKETQPNQMAPEKEEVPPPHY